MQICHTIHSTMSTQARDNVKGCNQAWRTIKQKQSHVATPRSHVFDSHVPNRQWQHGKKIMRHTSQCFGRFLRVKVCVFSVFVFCFVCFSACFFVCIFVCFFFSGEGWGTIFPQLYKSMEPRRWRYYWTDFSPHVSLGSWIPRRGFPIPDFEFQGL